MILCSVSTNGSFLCVLDICKLRFELKKLVFFISWKHGACVDFCVTIWNSQQPQLFLSPHLYKKLVTDFFFHFLVTISPFISHIDFYFITRSDLAAWLWVFLRQKLFKSFSKSINIVAKAWHRRLINIQITVLIFF